MEKISRDEALEKGLKLYFTGEPCRRGGIAPRYAKTGACRCDLCKRALKEREQTEHHRERYRRNARQYYWNNREYCREMSRRYSEEHREQCLEYQRKWREDNKDHVLEYYASYRDANRDKLKEYNDRYYKKNKHEYSRRCKEYRDKKKEVTPKWYDASKAKEFYDLAGMLRDATGEDWEVDHIIPIKAKKVCGLHWDGNLQVIPATLNRAKGNKLKYTGYLEWLEDYDRTLYSPVSFEVARDGQIKVIKG